MFTQASQADCPVTECKIYEKGCEKVLVTEKLEFGIETEFWPLTAITNEKLGYNLTFCIKCNGV